MGAPIDYGYRATQLTKNKKYALNMRSQGTAVLVDTNLLDRGEQASEGRRGDDIVVELIAEVYGLISGPPGWRKSLMLKSLPFLFW